jgi:hypothetical protein
MGTWDRNTIDKMMERETGIEPATSNLESWRQPLGQRRIGELQRAEWGTVGANGLNGAEMGTQTTNVLYVLLLAAVIVAVDFLFFKNVFWERLTVNVGIVLIFVAFYFRFLKRP